MVENYGTLNVEGGEISSEGGYPINNYGDANVYGGKIYSESAGAVANAGNLIISGGAITSDAVDEDNESAITSYDGKLVIYGDCTITSTAYLAIDVVGGEFTMDNGTVSGKEGGIQLVKDSTGSTGEITGGSIESENGYALYVGNSTCTISGGTIKNESTMKPAVYCFTEDESDEDSPNLTITWPGKVESDEGPLIVSTKEHSTLCGTISTLDTDAGDKNYAKVEISGGYIFSNDTYAVFSQSSTSTVSIANCYTNLGSMTGSGATQSPYYANGGTQFKPSSQLSSSISCDGYDYEFGYQITSASEEDTWTYVIDACSQTKTKIGAYEAVSYSFRCYKKKGDQQEAVPWKAQMYVDGNAGFGWNDNHNFGPMDGWYWTTSHDDTSGTDHGAGSPYNNEYYIITFMSTRSDTYTVKIIASDAGGGTSYTFAPVVQTIGSDSSTPPIWGGSSAEATITSSDFTKANPQSGCVLRVYGEANQPNNPLNSIKVTLIAQSPSYMSCDQYFSDGYADFEIDDTLFTALSSGGCQFKIDYGAIITKVELRQKIIL